MISFRMLASLSINRRLPHLYSRPFNYFKMPKRPHHHYNQELANMGTATNPKNVQKVFSENGQTANYVYRVVLTGGPWGGKSSSLDDMTKSLTEMGYDVMCVPEVPTILLNGGCKYPGTDSKNKEALIVFEKALIQAQLQLERSFIDIAESTNRPSLVIMDRGLLDVAAYLPANLWGETLKAVDLTEEQIAGRYDLVLHLTTAADGAEKFYTTENNAARLETSEQARALDQKIRTGYQRAHKNVKVVDNSTDFQGKLKRATDYVIELVEGKSS